MKKFKPVDMSNVSEQQRSVLALTFPELLDIYCQAKPGKRPDIREFRLRKWRAQFKDISAWELQPEHVAVMVDAMESYDYAAPTINRDVADIASCYAWAIKRRYCPADFQSPTREYDRRPDTIRRVELSERDLSRLLSFAKLSNWHKLYTLVLAALHTGARKSELMGLKWADVDLVSGRAILHDTKAGVPRRLMLTEMLVEALSSIRPSPCPEQAIVFCGRNPFRAHDFRKAWERCRSDASLDDLRFHDLRHASAAQLLRAGNSLHTVAQILGHRDTRMLARVYGHLDDAHLHASVASSWSHSNEL